ncbi:hypothetical protein D9756_010644 [Leucocoprinus leucothites]|uniref:Uncharacterized protein n=1 Tax=Leucocoprinus leucothites TaxID=201217 RepID=A0A8H5CT81_9AGAR|nr:hypothetical protein D9756_010644 [Leucoagaricus leucothites]
MPEGPSFKITDSTVTYVAGDQINHNHGGGNPLPRHEPQTNNNAAEESQPQLSAEETPSESSRFEFSARPQPPQHSTARRPSSSQQPPSQSQLGHGLHQSSSPPSTATNPPVAPQTTPSPVPPPLAQHSSPRPPPPARSTPSAWAPSSIASTPQATAPEPFHPHPAATPVQARPLFPPTFSMNRGWQGPYEDRPNQYFDTAEGIEQRNGYHATEGGQYASSYRNSGTAQSPLSPRQQPPYEHPAQYYYRTTSPQTYAAQSSRSQAYTPHNRPYNSYAPPPHGPQDPHAQNNRGSPTDPFPAQLEHHYRRTPDQ